MFHRKSTNVNLPTTSGIKYSVTGNTKTIRCYNTIEFHKQK